MRSTQGPIGSNARTSCALSNLSFTRLSREAGCLSLQLHHSYSSIPSILFLFICLGNLEIRVPARERAVDDVTRISKQWPVERLSS